MCVRASGDVLLSIEDLSVRFGANRTADPLVAVDGVDLQVEAGSTVGLVGESGCGKTTLARAIFNLVTPASGRILFDGVNVLSVRGRALRELRSDMQLVFQDPNDSLNPRMRAGEIVAEPLLIQRKTGFRRCRDEVLALFARVGLPAAYAERYPHALSGGQRQRVGIARALAHTPRLIVCDEPVSALDVSVQAQILNLLSDLQAEFELTYLFIAHDLAVVRHISRRIAVMYRGRIVEIGPADEVCRCAAHPYTRCLLEAVPSAHPNGRRHIQVVPYDPADVAATRQGCAFHARCPFVTDLCREAQPKLLQLGGGEADHRTACHHVEGVREAAEIVHTG